MERDLLMNLKQQPKLLRTISLCKNEKGMVLIAAIALVAILALVGTVAVVTTDTDMKISSNYKTNVQAFYIAEAGIQDGINRLIILYAPILFL